MKCNIWTIRSAVAALAFCATSSALGEINDHRILGQIVLDVDTIGGTPWGAYSDRHAPSGFINDEASVPDGSASYMFGMEYARLSLASSQAPGERVAGLWGNGVVKGSIFDRLTVTPGDPSLSGRPGRLTAMLEIAGSGSAAKPVEWEAFPSRIFGEFHVGVGAAGQGFGYSGIWEAFDRGQTVFTGDPFGTKTLEIDFIFGQPFDFDFSAVAGTNVDGRGPSGTAAASVELSSVRWMGISAVYDSGGQTIGNFSVLSDSGTDWSMAAAVPEPVALLLAAALSILFIRPSHRRAYCLPFCCVCSIILFARTGVAEPVHSVSQTVPSSTATLNPDLTSTPDSWFDVYLQTDKSTYILGEPVDVYLSVTNRGPKPALLDWTPMSRADLYVMQGDTVLWTLGGPIRFMGGSSPFPLAVAEVFELHHVWSMTDNMTSAEVVSVLPGQYSVGGYLAGAGGLSLPITIVPEPSAIASLLAGCLFLFARQRRGHRYNRG